MTRRQALTATAGLVAAATPASVQASDADVVKLLDAFAAAWNGHDVDGLMACMAEDAVRRAYAAVFDAYADARWNQPRHFVAGDRAVSEWTFTGTTKAGARVEVNGCDLFTLRGGRIAVKNSYRKQRG